MTLKLSIRIVSLALLGILFAASGSRAESLQLADFWRLTPDSDRPHAKTMRRALVVNGKATLAGCALSYRHVRPTYNVRSGELVQRDVFKAGGRLTVSLELLRGEETLKIAKRKFKVKKTNAWSRERLIIWTDGSGLDDANQCALYSCLDHTALISDAFPLQVRAGDVLYASLKFKKAPRLLGVQREGDLLRYDGLTVETICQTCGTTDLPCPER